MCEQESVNVLVVDAGIGCRECKETTHHRCDVLSGNARQLLNNSGDRMRRHRRPPLALLRLAAALHFALCLLMCLDGIAVGRSLLMGLGIDERLGAAGNVVIDLSLVSER